MFEEISKGYYAVIPATVRYDKELTPNAKLLYGEITALCNDKGYCWATNKYFAELYGVSIVSISKWIKALSERGHIQTNVCYKEGTKEIFNRYITILNDPIKEMFMPPIKEKFKENNTIYNNTINNKKENIKRKSNSVSRFVPPSLEEVQAYCRERNNNVDAERFIDYYIANGWQVGKNKMKDWKAAVRNWERSNYNKSIAHQEKQGTGNIFVDMMIEKGMVEKGDLNT